MATLSDVPLLIGLVFAQTDQLLIAAVLSSAAVALWRLWRGEALIKEAFNVAARGVETMVAAVCFHAVLGPAPAISARSWLAAFVAVPAANLVSGICVQVVIALSVGRVNRSGLKSVAVVLAGVAVLNVAVGRVAVVALWWDPVAAIPLLGIAVALGVGYRTYNQLLDRLRQEVAANVHHALHDELTGLGNRTLFTEQLEAALAQRGSEGVVAVMLMDLDRFKEVNDTLGHHTGDVMLQQIAAQLTQAVGGNGSVARLGGDEFAFVVAAPTRAEVGKVALDVLAGGQATVLVEGLRLEVRASLGVAVVPDDGTDRSTALRRADVAMYHAKTKATGVEFYQPERDPHSTRRLVLAGELRLALETSSIELYYQPQADMLTGRVGGVEALLRWTHPVYGTIAPDEFIPLAEQCGVIRPLTLWALEVGLTQLAVWRREGLDLTLSANLSPRSVFDAELADKLDALLAKTRVPPGALVLEITESSIFGDRPPGRTVLDHLADLGVGLSIDDFGTGFSSLTRLARLPVHEIKIDKSFVTSMLSNVDHDAIVRSTIDLARNMELRVVAEGVENERTWIRLGQLGCDVGQGYYLSPPLRASELASWLWQRQRRDVPRPLRPLAG